MISRFWRASSSRCAFSSHTISITRRCLVIPWRVTSEPAEFQPFIAKAGKPMASYPIDVWLDWLQTYGLLWVGTMNSIGPSAGRHSRIIRGIAGTGQSDTTDFSIMDPAGGVMYQESFTRTRSLTTTIRSGTLLRNGRQLRAWFERTQSSVRDRASAAASMRHRIPQAACRWRW